MGMIISNKWSSRLIDLTKDLQIAGFERSAKLTHRNLNVERYIIGPKRDSLTVDQLEGILTKLDFPKQYLPQVLTQLNESNQCGLGFERKKRVSSYRLYFEFFDRYKSDPSLNNGILHIGYKWQCDDPARIVVTRYSFPRLFDGKNPEQIIRKIFVAADEDFVGNVVAAVHKTVADIPHRDRIMTYATEESGCRRSFDMNVYRGRKKMSFLKCELENIGAFFKIEDIVLTSFINETQNADVGHVSSGFDSSNNPFFTLYFDDLTPFLSDKQNQ